MGVGSSSGCREYNTTTRAPGKSSTAHAGHLTHPYGKHPRPKQQQPPAPPFSALGPRVLKIGPSGAARGDGDDGDYIDISNPSPSPHTQRPRQTGPGGGMVNAVMGVMGSRRIVVDVAVIWTPPITPITPITIISHPPAYPHVVSDCRPPGASRARRGVSRAARGPRGIDPVSVQLPGVSEALGEHMSVMGSRGSTHHTHHHPPYREPREVTLPGVLG